MMKSIFILVYSLLLLSAAPRDIEGALTIQVENIESIEGQLWLGIYTSQQNFLQQTESVRILGKKVDRTGSIVVRADDLPFGTYAIAVFHDKNNNGQLDQNLVGVPKEPYAFSQQLKSKWRAPSYDEVKFVFKYSNQKLHMRLENW